MWSVTYTGILRYEDAPLIMWSACAKLHEYELCCGEFQWFLSNWIARLGCLHAFYKLEETNESIGRLSPGFTLLFSSLKARISSILFALQIPRFGSFINKIFHYSVTNRIIAQKFTKRHTKLRTQKYWIICIALLHILQRVHALKE